MKMKEQITALEAIDKKMSAADVYKHYFPGATDDQVDYFLWECTPFPLCTEKTLDCIYKAYVSRFKEMFCKKHYRTA